MSSACIDTGFSLQLSKVVPPTTCIEVLGIIVDSVSMELQISEERLLETIKELKKWQNRHGCKKRKKDLLSLIGKLNFIAGVVKPGRTF